MFFFIFPRNLQTPYCQQISNQARMNDTTRRTEKERPLVAIPFLHPLFSHLDALKGIRPRSARMEDYIVIIKD